MHIFRFIFIFRGTTGISLHDFQSAKARNTPANPLEETVSVSLVSSAVKVINETSIR